MMIGMMILDAVAILGKGVTNHSEFKQTVLAFLINMISHLQAQQAIVTRGSKQTTLQCPISCCTAVLSTALGLRRSNIQTCDQRLHSSFLQQMSPWSIGSVYTIAFSVITCIGGILGFDHTSSRQDEDDIQFARRPSTLLAYAYLTPYKGMSNQ